VSYVELAEALSYVRTGIDQLHVQAALLASARGINAYCKRPFTVPTAATVREYVPNNEHDPSLLCVYDIANTTDLVVLNNGTTVTAAGYQLEIAPGFPNQTNSSGLVEPWQYIRLLSGTWACPANGEATVSITARHGWPAVPDDVPLSQLMLIRDLCDGRETRFGVVAFADAGVARAIRENGQVTAMLSPLRSARVWGIA
jgi:hypothetical protein